MTIRIGTRASTLALLQTRRVVERVRAARPGLTVEIVEIATHGDLDADRPLPEIGGEGLFTARIEQALHDGAIDAAVHSLKDLPVDDPVGLVIGAVMGREEPRDVLVARDGLTLDTLPVGSVVGSSSTRRQAQLLFRRRDLVMRPIRGNVETRISKVLRGEYDATILAGAGLVRLGLTDRITEWIALSAFLPAPGQGAIAVQCRSGDPLTGEMLAAIDEPLLRAETDAERWFLRVLGAGCSAPVAAFAQGQRASPDRAAPPRSAASRAAEAGAAPRAAAEGGPHAAFHIRFHIRMKCRVSAPDGSKAIEVEGNGADPRRLAESLAGDALKAGAAAILAAVGKKNRLGGNGAAMRPAAGKPYSQHGTAALAPGSGDTSALMGKRVLVTRAAEQAAGVCQQLVARGAIPVFLPMIRIEPAGDRALLDEALRALSDFRWILFTSANAVELLARRAAELGLSLQGPKIAAVGPATADCLSRYGLSVDFVPAEHTAASLAEGLRNLEQNGIAGARVLLPRAEEDREEAIALLRACGARVQDIVVYRSAPADVSETDVARLAPGIDAILFTSGSTVRAYCEHARSFSALAAAARTAAIACIGPSTRETAEERGLAVAVIPAEHTTAALVAALGDHFARARREEK
jgi:hydroxymethylbilane synthase